MFLYIGPCNWLTDYLSARWIIRYFREHQTWHRAWIQPRHLRRSTEFSQKQWSLAVFQGHSRWSKVTLLDMTSVLSVPLTPSSQDRPICNGWTHCPVFLRSLICDTLFHYCLRFHVERPRLRGSWSLIHLVMMIWFTHDSRLWLSPFFNLHLRKISWPWNRGYGVTGGH